MADATAMRQEADAARGGAARVVTNASGPEPSFRMSAIAAMPFPKAVAWNGAQHFSRSLFKQNRSFTAISGYSLFALTPGGRLVRVAQQILGIEMPKD